MNGWEFHKLLSERVAKYGLTVKLATESPHMPHTGVIMMPKGGDRRAERVRPPSEARRLPRQSIPSRATKDLLNGHRQRGAVDNDNLPEDLPRDDRVDMQGNTQEQAINELREIKGQEWYRQMRVRLKIPYVWEEYLSLN